MAVKPETKLITAVHRNLISSIYREKMSNPYRGGTPDVYYEGTNGHLWVEYKQIDGGLPPVLELTNLKKPYTLSPLQQQWLDRAFLNRQPVAVILGWNTGRQRRAMIFFKRSWAQSYERTVLQAKAFSIEAIAGVIRQQVMKR